jgi:IMP dehydrogenase
VNATTVEEIKIKANFIEMSSNGISESRAHGVKS